MRLLGLTSRLTTIHPVFFVVQHSYSIGVIILSKIPNRERPSGIIYLERYAFASVFHHFSTATLSMRDNNILHEFGEEKKKRNTQISHVVPL